MREATDSFSPEAGARTRCPWAGRDALYRAYHDTEWGVPVHDDRLLFEFLVLEGAQAGLSWATILKKRAAYRKAFHEFDVTRVAEYRAREIRSLLRNEGIVRNRRKVESTVQNACAFLEVVREFGSFDRYIWGLAGGMPRVNRFRRMRDVPAQTSVSRAMSQDLRRRGFTFVGPTICYAFMQAVGMVNDHLVECFRWRELQ